MSEPAGLIGRENLTTVVAVAAVTALFALAYGVHLNRQIQVVAVGASSLDVKAARRDVALEQQLEALTKRVAELEAAQVSARTPVAAGVGAETAGAGADEAGSVPAPK